MQTNGRRYPYSNTPSSTYDDYQTSDYGSPPRKDTKSVADWRSGHALHDSLDYGSQKMGGHPNGVSQRLPTNVGMLDDVSLHLLYETAMLECQGYHVLGMDEVDDLKKERTRLVSRLDAANRKLILENKVKDAAQNIHRLYSVGLRNRPDTPQSPTSPQRSRGSLLGGRTRDSNSSANGVGSQGQAVHQAQDELAVSIKRVDELNETIKLIQEQVAQIDRRLLSHTAAVLAEQTQRASRLAGASISRRGSAMGEDGDAGYLPDEFDGIRDILRGKPSKRMALPQQSDEQLEDVHARLERLNDQLRQVINEASRARGIQSQPEPEVRNVGGNGVTPQIEEAVSRLEQKLLLLNQEQQIGLNELQGARGKADAHAQKVDENSQKLVEYSQKLDENAQKLDDYSQRLDEYEATVNGLWDIMRMDSGGNSPGGAASSNQGFSLPAFSARVQNLFDRAQSANEQQDILRRQIQQQRDLNGRSDVEKDGQIAELQNRNNDLLRGHSELQEQLTTIVSKHAQSENEASQYQTELQKVLAESESLQSMIETRQKERDQMASQLQSFKQNAESAEALESEVVRLTTELAMAKAELDGAYGTRAERKKEAEAANGDRTKALEQELQEMATEFQELTRESVEMEKEREQLDALIDSLRERCEQLETQLGEEKAKWIGGKGASATDANGRENTSVAVMRQEFKRMMRESRAEGLKALKVEQEERRRLETELRRLRHGNGSLAARNGSLSASTASAVA